MKTFVHFILFAAVSVMLFSCQKELSKDTSLPVGSNPDENNNTSIIGDWNYIATDMDVAVSGQTTDPDLGTVKFIQAYKTTTINNKGSLKFTATDFQSTNLSYSISTNIEISTIVPGVPADKQTIPFNFDVPASNSTAKYQQVGSDSLYFPDGALISIPDASGAIPPSAYSEPSGGRFSIVSDTLKIFGNVNASATQNIEGLDFSVSQKASIVMRYKRK